MKTIDLETNVTVRQAYLIMFEYLDKYWTEYGKPEEIGMILSTLSLWDSEEGKVPMDSSIFPTWLTCAKKIIEDEDTENGYRNADIQLTK